MPTTGCAVLEDDCIRLSVVVFEDRNTDLLMPNGNNNGQRLIRLKRVRTVRRLKRPVRRDHDTSIINDKEGWWGLYL